MTVQRLEGDRVVLRALAAEDVARIVELGSDPSVARWWPNINAPYVLQKAQGDASATAFAVEADGEVIGLAQYWEEEDPEYRHAGIDLFLAASHQGRGLGSDTVRTLALHLFRDRGHHRITIDPAAENVRAIRCYERVGFHRVGVMRRYWRGPDGAWHDGLLLDLLPDDL